MHVNELRGKADAFQLYHSRERNDMILSLYMYAFLGRTFTE